MSNSLTKLRRKFMNERLNHMMVEHRKLVKALDDYYDSLQKSSTLHTPETMSHEWKY